MGRTTWLVVGVRSGVAWPTKDTKIVFRGLELVLRPETAHLDASIAVSYQPPQTWSDVLHVVRQFMSALTWVEGAHITETTTGGGSVPMGVGTKGMARYVNPHFRVEYLPEVGSDKARIALALYREALGVNSIPYKVLGFFKVINVLYEKGKDQTSWIRESLPNLQDYEARKRIGDLAASGEDVAQYLYESGRCAVAHAFATPVVDPENPKDLDRLRADLPVIKSLAEHFIERELGVKSRRTVWNEHLYELEGFREILGPSFVSEVKRGITLASTDFPSLPQLSIRLRDRTRREAFERMSCEVVGVGGGAVLVRCVSSGEDLYAGLVLNLKEERLLFDPVNGTIVSDDGSPGSARARLDRIMFMSDFIANGELEVWHAEGERRLGRCDPHIPVNIDLGKTLEAWRELAGEIEQEIRRRENTQETPDSAAQ